MSLREKSRFGKWVSDCLSKKRYVSRHMAVTVARDIERKRGVILRAYQCPHCGGWHLTKNV